MPALFRAANRFKAPPQVTPWTGVRDATLLGPPAIQGQGTTFGEHEPARSEDCLVLNVWTPAVKDGRKRPVLFYCHGGGFTSGSGGQNIQDGSHLAATYDVVVVAANHRLGLFGLLYLGELSGEEYATSGNQGLLDTLWLPLAGGRAFLLHRASPRGRVITRASAP
jgi:para-nitrobenzyl esterase